MKYSPSPAHTVSNREVVFRLVLLEAARRARLPYAPSIAGAALAATAVGAASGGAPSLEVLALAVYWGHLYAQTRNILIPLSMHALWNALALAYFGSAFLV